MTSAQVVETSVNVISNSPSQDYTHPDDRTLLYEIFIYNKLLSIIAIPQVAVLIEAGGCTKVFYIKYLLKTDN